MKNIIFILLATILFFSCNQHSKISKDFNCKTTVYYNLEKIKDIKKSFSVQLPKSWKTNLFYDDIQSSIYSADTTKQLTETILLDITAINRNINFDTTFKLKQEQENLSKKLIKIKSKETTILNKPSYYTLSKGKKRNFQYQVSHIYIKTNEQNFILVKAEVYGDSLVNNRMCNAFTLIEKIKITQ